MTEEELLKLIKEVYDIAENGVNEAHLGSTVKIRNLIRSHECFRYIWYRNWEE